MEPVEPVLVKILIQCASICQPLSITMGLHLANSLIDGTPVKDNVIWFLRKYTQWCDGRDSDCPILGRGYWRGFMERNGHLIIGKKGQKFAIDCHKWSSYLNISQMYDFVYDEMVDAGVAEKLPEAVWMDKEGNEVEDEADAYGCKVTHRLIHPDHVLFMDKVGSNTAQTGDGHIGRERKLVA
jgi:hypothetical protein